jgi:HNH endonuclease
MLTALQKWPTPSMPEHDSPMAETIVRFWAKVNKDGPIPKHCPELGACWLWTASLRNKGYGAFSYRYAGQCVQARAHRFSWELAYGAIPDGLCVLHRCDTPACVNPHHLWIGTKAENNADMQQKGRKVSGGTYRRDNYKYPRGFVWHRRHGKASALTGDFDYEAIQHDRHVHHLTYHQIAQKHGVSKTHASRICRKGGGAC